MKIPRERGEILDQIQVALSMMIIEHNATTCDQRPEISSEKDP